MSDHSVIAGLGFGDEGKGAVVDALCASTAVSAVVRYNGGPQAAHNVLLPDGRHHTFAQFGSGYFRGVHTFLSRFMLVNPLNLEVEARHLREITGTNPYDFLSIDGESLLVTPYHVAANRWREKQRGGGRHGSCGQGVGEARRFALEHPEAAPVLNDVVHNPDILLEKLINIKALLEYELGVTFSGRPWDVATAIRKATPRGVVEDRWGLRDWLDRGPCVFEGAQGVLLDENYGFHPYTTWSTTTFENADTLLSECGHTAKHLGVLRAYHTRHGSGPFPTEDERLVKHEAHNGLGEWQGAWRVGHLDLVLLRWAMFACQNRVDELAVTHLDQTTGVKVCNSYEGGIEHLETAYSRDGFQSMHEATEFLQNLTPELMSWISPSMPETYLGLIESTLGVPVSIQSYGPTADDKRIAVTA